MACHRRMYLCCRSIVRHPAGIACCQPRIARSLRQGKVAMAKRTSETCPCRRQTACTHRQKPYVVCVLGQQQSGLLLPSWLPDVQCKSSPRLGIREATPSKHRTVDGRRHSILPRLCRQQRRGPPGGRGWPQRQCKRLVEEATGVHVARRLSCWVVPAAKATADHK